MRTGYTTVDVTEMGVGARDIWRSAIDRSLSGNTGEFKIGTVLEVFDRSVYLEFDHEGPSDRAVPPIVLLGTNGLGSGPLLTRIDTGPGFSFDDLGISTDGVCRIGRSAASGRPEHFALTVDGVFDVRLDADLLRPSEETIDQYHDVRSIQREDDAWKRTRATLEWVVESDIEDGLDWFSDLATVVRDDRALRSSTPFGRMVASWEESIEAPSSTRFDVEPWEVLIGRGPGATPSGDDIISGVLLTLNRVSEGKLRNEIQNVGMEIVSRALGSTTNVSASLMEQAALGRGPDEATRCLRRLLTPTRMDERRSAVSDLIEVGHTSGADLLFGMFFAVLAILPAIGATR